MPILPRHTDADYSDMQEEADMRDEADTDDCEGPCDDHDVEDFSAEIWAPHMSGMRTWHGESWSGVACDLI